MDRNIEISEAVWSDIEQVLKLWQITWKQHAKRQPEAFNIPPIKSWEQKLRRGFRLRWRKGKFQYYSPILLVARSDGVFAGHLLFKFAKGHKRNAALIQDISVHSDFQRNGVAKALITEFRRVCRAEAIEKVDAMVWRGNTASEAFFSSEGFSDQYTLMRANWRA